jgi:ADP-ribosyl-[dinitrogen reductase] hydrolase
VTASTIELRDRFLGCLLGCAVGDALGAPYEGLWSQSIPSEDLLLAGFAEFEGYPRGQYTDDTQLSVATIKAILKVRDVDPHEIARYIARLWMNQSVIGPGGACTQAAHRFLKFRDWTSCGAPAGQAGNGTAMRTSVLGLFFLWDVRRLPSAVADVAKITHQDPRSIAGGVAIAKAAQSLAIDRFTLPRSFCDEIATTVEPYEDRFADMIRMLPRLLEAGEDVAIPVIAWSGMERPEFFQPIITPFVIPTVLAALWCVLKHPDSWTKAVAAAIRLGGDVDTLGAIVGALMGTKLGLGAIPRHLVDGVVDSERLHGIAVRYHALVVSENRQIKA